MFMPTQQKKEHNYFGGYTLLETLVAIVVLSLAIVAPLGIASKSLFQALLAKEQLTAFYLAQEGMEAMRHLRDTNILRTGGGPTGYDWLDGIPVPLDQDLYIDVSTIGSGAPHRVEPDLCPGGVCPPLTLDPNSGLYAYDELNDPASPFTRIVRVTPSTNGNPDEVSVIVTVNWSVGENNRSVVLREVLFNWQN